MTGSGTLVIAGTPIGNLGDASARLRAELAGADLIAAEDTRRARKLIDGLDISTSARLISYYDAVEVERVPVILDMLRDGKRVVLISDAGMPIVSDPGHRLVARCQQEGIPTTVVPGPSAVLSAVAVSGLGGNRFTFEGFLPRKAGERRQAVDGLKTEVRTMVFFESPHRLTTTLQTLSSVLGADRRAVVCRELTKMFEEIRAGTLTELIDWSTSGVRGEICIVVAGSTAAVPRRAEFASDADPRKAAIAAVAAAFDLPRGAVYDAIVAAKQAKRSTGSAVPGYKPDGS